jgi:hypothetical protein
MSGAGERDKVRAAIAAKFSRSGRGRRPLGARVDAILTAPKMPRPRAAPHRPWFIYFMQDGHCGDIKIGRSVHPERRLNELKVARRHLRIVLLVKIERGDTLREEDLHRLFATDCLAGEWFEPSARLVVFINAMFDESHELMKMLRANARARRRCEGECR